MTLGVRSFSLVSSWLILRSRARGLASTVALCCAAVTLSSPSPVQAGGVYLTPLGAEPAARGGARVAGVSDPHALWYNPAGLAYSKRQLVVDLNMPIARASFTRFMPDGTSDVTANAKPTVLPTPVIAYSDDFGLRHWGFGVGIIVPPAFALAWPSEVNGGPAPQRYSILDTNGSAIGSLALAAAYRPLDRLSLGAALYVTSAQVAGKVAISACDYAFCSQPEAPEWEGRTSFLLGPVVTASAIFGARWDFDHLRIGGSVQLRTKLSGDAQVKIALPDQSIFDGVTLQNAKGGDDLHAKMSLTLPTIIRLGVEGDLDPNTKVELGGTWENWAAQRNISVRPIGVVARDVPGVGDVRAEPVSLATNMRATWAVNLGGTHDFSRYLHGRKLFGNAGFMFETSSLAPRDLSATTLDTNKVMLAIGGSVEVVHGMLVDLSYGHFFMVNHVVRNSRVLLPAAIRPLPTDTNPQEYEVGDRPAIGNGRYTVEADFVAIGLRWLIEETRAYYRGAPASP